MQIDVKLHFIQPNDVKYKRDCKDTNIIRKVYANYLDVKLHFIQLNDLMIFRLFAL